MNAWTWVDDYPQQYGWSEQNEPEWTPVYDALERAQEDYDPEEHSNYVAFANPDYQAINRGEWEEIGLTEREALERYF